MATLAIPITKAGKGGNFAISQEDAEAFIEAHPEMVRHMFIAFAKEQLNAGMSKTTEFPATRDLDGDDLASARDHALEKAAENWETLKSGKLVKRAGPGTSKQTSKEPKEVITEAKRQCKEVVRDRLKAAKVRISTVAARDITAAAEKLFAEREEFYIAKAKATLNERTAEDTAEVDVLSIAKPDPKRVAKLEKDKAERKAATSAKQAGMPAKRGAKAKTVPPRRGDTPQHSVTH